MAATKCVKNAIKAYDKNRNFGRRLNAAATKWMNNVEIKMAILDSGATGNFLTINAPIKNVNPNVTLPGGTNINSTVQGEID